MKYKVFISYNVSILCFRQKGLIPLKCFAENVQFPAYKMSPLVQKSDHTYWLTKPSHTQLIIKFTMRKQRPLKHLMPVADVGSVLKCKWDKNGCFNPSIWQWYLIYNFGIFHVQNTFCLLNGSIHRFVMKITNVLIVIWKNPLLSK